MVFHKLHYRGLDFASLEDGLNMYFLCPTCKWEWQPRQSFNTSFPARVDINTLIAFLVPVHDDPSTKKACSVGGEEIQLYVAVHREPAIDYDLICIQRSDAEGAGGIESDWWLLSGEVS